MITLFCFGITINKERMIQSSSKEVDLPESLYCQLCRYVDNGLTDTVNEIVSTANVESKESDI